MSEIKQANFRISTTAADTFRAFCEDQGINQAQGFEHLLEVLALANARNALKSRETEIADFENHAKTLISTYLHSLELNENAEARIREEFAMQLESQTQTIVNYQEQMSLLNDQLEKAVENAEAYRTDFQALQDNMEENINLRKQVEKDYIILKEEKEKQLRDKESIIAMLTDKLLVAERKAEGYDDLEKQNSVFKERLAVAEQTIKDNKKDAQIALERAVRKAEKVLEAEHHKESLRLRSQITKLMQDLSENERSANEQIRTLDKTNADLRESIADLKARISLYERNNAYDENNVSRE